MRYFNYDDNEDYQNEINNFFGEDFKFNDNDDDYDDDEEYEMIFESIFENKKIDVKILEMAIKTSSSSFLWNFLSIKTKLKRIKESYKDLLSIIEDE